MIKGKLEYLQDTKEAIKQAIIDKGQEVADTDTFRSYADKINAIETSPSLIAKTITENGTYNASDDNADGYSSVVVDINLKVYEVSSTLENLTTSGKSFAINNTDYVATLTPSQYYEVPETIEVKRNGVVATEGVDYTYKKVYNNITLSMSSSNRHGGDVYYTLNDGEQTLLGKMYDYSVTEGVQSIVLNDVYKLTVYIYCDDVPYGTIKNANGELLHSVSESLLDVTPYLQDGLKINGDVKG